MIYYSFVHLHAPVFSKGKNFGDKFHANDKTGNKIYGEEGSNLITIEHHLGKTIVNGWHSADPIEEKVVIKKREPKSGQGEA